MRINKLVDELYEKRGMKKTENKGLKEARSRLMDSIDKEMIKIKKTESKDLYNAEQSTTSKYISKIKSDLDNHIMLLNNSFKDNKLGDINFSGLTARPNVLNLEDEEYKLANPLTSKKLNPIATL